MGFTDWILKHGFGSPGSTAKAFIKFYNQFGVSHHLEEWEEAFTAIFTARFFSYQKMGFPGGCLLNQSNALDIVKVSKGDLPLFIFAMMLLETSQFRDNVLNYLDKVIEVIYSTVNETKPTSIRFSLSELKTIIKETIL